MSSQKRNSHLEIQARRYHASSSLNDKVVHSFLQSLDCPRSLTVWLLYSCGEHQQLADLDIKPEWYNSPFQFRDAYTATSFLSKANFLKLSSPKKVVAFEKFFKFEELCKQTNHRFRNLASDPLFNGSNVWLLNATIRKISNILGDFCVEEMFEHANWGPGVTTLLKGEHVSAVNKFQSETGITRDLYSLVGDSLPRAYPGWLGHRTGLIGTEKWPNFQVGNTIVTVPKNSKTDRVIAVEPGINLWFQKGIGTMIRRRLQRVGIDLTDQTRNQQLARQSSKDDRLATVDFSSASDSIARELVRELLPPRWFAIMNACRSTLGTHDKKHVHWEKFSSMGNGFTFELESLIFYAAAESVKELADSVGEISVFGDDVIIPSACYELFAAFSEFLGFKVNLEKSFSKGYFRESCGAHYYSGIDCKPIFLKEKLQNVHSVYKLANSIRAYAHRRNSYYGCDHRFRDTWHHLLHGVPSPLRTKTSLGLGDGGFVCNFDEALPSVSRAAHGIEGYRTLQLVNVGVESDHFEGEGLLLARLKTQSLQAYGNTYTLRGRSRIRVARVLVVQWYNLGPWI